MNKVRVLGGVLIIIGIILVYTVNSDGIGFIAGAILGIGIGLLLTGKISFITKT